MNTVPPTYETGVIHGRFQILHNDHLAYLMSGKALCRHLVVGITNPDPHTTKQEQTDTNRSGTAANPLTYYERQWLVRTALAAEGVPSEAFTIVPLPINFPERYRYYVPMDAVFFLAIYDRWGERKLSYFRGLGLRTHVLRRVPEEQKGISASDIREKMIQGKPWKHLVPPSVGELLDTWRIPERLRTGLSDSDG